MIFATPFEVMNRALEIARYGRGSVEPNPPVGAVIVSDDGTCLGEGWHQKFGGPHAEIHAIAAAGSSTRGATLYVTLEPCSHFGKTPPCTRSVIEAGIRKVVVAVEDPADHGRGKGIAELRAAGVDVELGLLADAGRRLIAPFAKLKTRRQPWVIAKWAMTLDGKIATRSGESQWISGEQSRHRVHQLRGIVDAILVGRGTVQYDDPLLTARPPGPRSQTRIVLDTAAQMRLDSQLVQTAKEFKTLVVVTDRASTEKCRSLQDCGVEVMKLAANESGHPDITLLLDELGRREMNNLLVEGGGSVLGSFFDRDAIDEVHVFIAPKLVGGATASSPMAGFGRELMKQAAALSDVEYEILGSDVYVHGFVATDETMANG